MLQIAQGMKGRLACSNLSNIILPQFTHLQSLATPPGIPFSTSPSPLYSDRDFVPRQCPPEPTPGLSHRQVFYVHLRVPEMAATTSPYLSFGMFGFVGDCCRWICNCRVDGRVGVAAWGVSSNWSCGDYGFKW